MREKWEVIEEAPNYSVSNYGEVVNTRTHTVLKPHITNGYLVVALRNNGRQVNRKIHRLVALAFCHGFVSGLDVNHLDGDKQNNDARNLEWTTRRKNVQHAFDNGFVVSGRRQKLRIIETGEVFESQLACARAIGGYQTSISAVLNGRQMHHLGYTFELIED